MVNTSNHFAVDKYGVIFVNPSNFIRADLSQYAIGGLITDANGKLQVHLKNGSCLYDNDGLVIRISPYGSIFCANSSLAIKTNFSNSITASASSLKLSDDFHKNIDYIKSNRK